MEINQFWSTYNVKSPDQDKDFVKEIWQTNTVFNTKNWYTQFFESLGKEGTTKLLGDVNAANFRTYNDYLGKRRHLDIENGTGFNVVNFYTKDELEKQFLDAGFTIYKQRNDLEWSWILPRSLYILRK